MITDVDGVLTDGGIFYSKNGEFLKKFNTRDSMGMELLLNCGIKTVMLTRENSEIVKKRAKKIARNISTNTAIILEAHYIPSFKPSKKFTNSVKENNKIIE